MDLILRDKFLEKWQNYFGREELPITFFFTDEQVQEREIISEKWNCMLSKLNLVRKGHSISLSKDSIACDAALGYIGFTEIPTSVCDYLSTGAEKYKRDPEMIKAYVDQLEIVPPPKKYLTFKRWEMLEEEDNPEVVKMTK